MSSKAHSGQKAAAPPGTSEVCKFAWLHLHISWGLVKLACGSKFTESLTVAATGSSRKGNLKPSIFIFMSCTFLQQSRCRQILQSASGLAMLLMLISRTTAVRGTAWGIAWNLRKWAGELKRWTQCRIGILTSPLQK